MVTVTIDGELESRFEALGAKTDSLKAELARHLLEEAVLFIQEREALAARVEDELDKAFSGPTHTLSDQDWEDLLAGRFKYDLEPARSVRGRELRAK